MRLSLAEFKYGKNRHWPSPADTDVMVMNNAEGDQIRCGTLNSGGMIIELRDARRPEMPVSYSTDNDGERVMLACHLLKGLNDFKIVRQKT